MELFSKYLEDNRMIRAGKQNFPITIRSFINMPITIPAGTKIGNNIVNKTVTFFVTSYDDDFVTLSSIENNTLPDDEEWDSDGEYNQDTTMKINISKKEFEKLLNVPPSKNQGSI